MADSTKCEGHVDVTAPAARGRANGRRGAGVLKAVLVTYDEPSATQHELERLFLELCNAARLPRPRTQARIDLPGGDTIFVDFLWPDSNLIVETDGHATHGTLRAFERDRRRDRHLTVLGYRVARFTWRDVRHRPDEVTATLDALLYAGRSPDSAATAPSPTYTPP